MEEKEIRRRINNNIQSKLCCASMAPIQCNKSATLPRQVFYRRRLRHIFKLSCIGSRTLDFWVTWVSGDAEDTKLSDHSKSQARQCSSLLRRYFVCGPRSTSSTTLLLLRRRLKLDHIRAKVQLCRNRGLGGALLCFLDAIVRLHTLCILHLFFFLPLLFLVDSFGLLKLIPFDSLRWSHILHLYRFDGLLD